MEDIWKKTYESGKSLFRDSLTTPPHSSNDVLGAATATQEGFVVVRTLTAQSDATNAQSSGNVQICAVPSDSGHATASIISDMIAKHMLNTEQAQAFRLVAEHAEKDQAESFTMFLGGAGGTGKSRVITALSDFFASRNEKRRLRLAAYTGIAAAGIRGITLHTALNLNQLKRMLESNGNCSRKQLVAAWDGVDYLFIDEVSMVGCELLYDISNALSLAKGSSLPFGGVNVIFAGDFLQLPPVGSTPLYSAPESLISKPNDSLTEDGQKKLKGLTLWQGLNHVVLLTQSMRQSGPENELFRQLLAKSRFGNTTNEQIDLLETRVLGKAAVDLSDPTWATAPIITRSNAVKDALNI